MNVPILLSLMELMRLEAQAHNHSGNASLPHGRKFERKSKDAVLESAGVTSHNSWCVVTHVTTKVRQIWRVCFLDTLGIVQA